MNSQLLHEIQKYSRQALGETLDQCTALGESLNQPAAKYCHELSNFRSDTFMTTAEPHIRDLWRLPSSKSANSNPGATVQPTRLKLVSALVKEPNQVLRRTQS